MTMEAVATAYAERGWHVVLLHGRREDGSCTCGVTREADPKHAVAKHPRLKGWQDGGAPDGDAVTRMLRQWPQSNIGLACGPKSGFFVLDVDPEKDGNAKLEALCAANSQLPKTYTVMTGSGGAHYYFLLPEGMSVSNSRGKLPGGLDIRGDGGQVVAPPSVTDKGQYIVLDDVPIADAPAWLLDLIRREAPKPVQPSGIERTDVELAAYVQTIVDREVDQALEGAGGRNNALNEACFSVATLIPHGVIDEDYVREVFIAAGEATGLGVIEVRKTVDSAIKGGIRKPRSPWPPPENVYLTERSDLELETVGGGTGFGQVQARPWNDVGNGYRMLDHFGRILRWVPERGKWAVYRGGKWAYSTEAARELVHRMLEKASALEGLLYSDITQTTEDTKGKQTTKPSDRDNFDLWLSKQAMSTRIDATLKEASAIARMRANATDFDSKPMLLNCPNGTIELPTRSIDGVKPAKLREHRPEDLLTQMTSVPYDPAAEAPWWTAFLGQVMPDDDARDLLHRVSGYSITGKTSEQCMFVHHGIGANGKSQFALAVSIILGDMAQSTPRETFMKHAGDRHPTDVARMVAKRFLTTIEPATGRGLNEELVKQLTGNDTMAARFMRADFFEFKPTGKIHYFTNHLPQMSNDGATWRRIRLFKWAVVIPVEQRVADLGETLAREEGSGILAWLVEGCARWAEHGLAMTETQAEAVREWADEEDDLAAWLAEDVLDAPGSFIAGADLYARWSTWCQRRGMMPGTADVLGRKLAEKGYERARRQHGTVRGFVGLALRTVSTSVLDDPE